MTPTSEYSPLSFTSTLGRLRLDPIQTINKTTANTVIPTNTAPPTATPTINGSWMSLGLMLAEGEGVEVEVEVEVKVEERVSVTVGSGQNRHKTIKWLLQNAHRSHCLLCTNFCTTVFI